MILVEKAGLFTTVQDEGRWGYQAYGMPVAGAMDRYAYRLANILAGNRPGAAALEMTFAGDTLRFDMAGVQHEVRITSLRKVDWASMRVNFFVMFPRADMPELPVTYIAAYRAPARAGFDNALVRQFPNITNVDTAQSIAQVQRVLDQVVRAVEFLFGFTLAAGLIVLFAAVSATREERAREFAVMRAVGAGSALLACAGCVTATAAASSAVCAKRVARDDRVRVVAADPAARRNRVVFRNRVSRDRRRRPLAIDRASSVVCCVPSVRGVSGNCVVRNRQGGVVTVNPAAVRRLAVADGEPVDPGRCRGGLRGGDDGAALPAVQDRLVDGPVALGQLGFVSGESAVEGYAVLECDPFRVCAGGDPDLVAGCRGGQAGGDCLFGRGPVGAVVGVVAGCAVNVNDHAGK